jgi:hypothetical protein
MAQEDTVIITDNYLIGLTRHSAIINRFPFIRQLSIKTPIRQASGCNSCGARSINRNTVSMTSEVKRILATMTESEVEAFKKLTRINKFTVIYNDRGKQLTVTR